MHDISHVKPIEEFREHASALPQDHSLPLPLLVFRKKKKKKKKELISRPFKELAFVTDL